MIYFVEDDNSIRELVVYTLTGQVSQARGFERPSLFWAAMEQQIPELILLDLMLPEEDGLTILKKLRMDARTEAVPVMILSAKSSEFDKVIGLDSGADDYLAKPFGMTELLARVRALLRRSQKQAAVSERYEIGCLQVSPEKHLVHVSGEAVILTLKEFDMLCMLLRNRGIVLTREQFLNQVWGYTFDGENRTVDVHIRTLRQKLGEAGKYISTIRGIGYKLEDTPDEE